MGDDHDGIDKVASSWTLRGWSPPWTRATVTLRGLKYPSIVFAYSNPIPLHSCNLHALLYAAHILLSCLLDMY